jgi:hypothetical protein
MKLQSTCMQARTPHTMCWKFSSSFQHWFSKILLGAIHFSIVHNTHMYDLNHTWKRICQGFAKLQSAHCPIVKSTIATFAFPPCPLHIAILPNCQVLVHPVHFLQWASSYPHIKKNLRVVHCTIFPPPWSAQNFCTKKSDCPWMFLVCPKPP